MISSTDDHTGAPAPKKNSIEWLKQRTEKAK
jgi:hypothetical protein